MMIEIRRVGFINKGAELMLYAVLEKMKEKYPNAKFCMAPSGNAPYEKRIKLGMYQKVHLWYKGIQFGLLANFIPKIIRDRYGLIMDHEIDVVIDAAGFAYSDQWGNNGTWELSNSTKRLKKYGAKVILLPQAFGPFENSLNQSSIKKAVKNIDLLFAREKISYDYLINICGER